MAIQQDEEYGANSQAAGQRHLRGHGFAAQQPGQQQADDRHHVFVGNSYADGGVAQQPEIGTIGDERSAQHQPGESGHGGRGDVFRPNLSRFSPQQARQQGLDPAENQEQRATAQGRERGADAAALGVQRSRDPAQGRAEHPEHAQGRGMAAAVPAEGQQDQSGEAAAQSQGLPQGGPGLSGEQPARQEHPDGHRAADDGGRGRGNAFLALAQKPAGDEYHEYGQQAGVAQVARAGVGALAVQPGQGVEQDSGQQHAQTAHEKGRQHGQRKLDAQIGGTPGNIEQEEAGQNFAMIDGQMHGGAPWTCPHGGVVLSIRGRAACQQAGTAERAFPAYRWNISGHFQNATPKFPCCIAPPRNGRAFSWQITPDVADWERRPIDFRVFGAPAAFFAARPFSFVRPRRTGRLRVQP